MPIFFALVLVPAAITEVEEIPEVGDVLVMDIQGNDLKPEMSRTITELVTSRLDRALRSKVLSGDEVKKLLKLEGDRQLSGECADESCMAEIAGALGARYIVFGRVTKFNDSLMVLNLGLYDSSKAVAIERTDFNADDINFLVRNLDDAVAPIAEKLVALSTPKPVEVVEAAPPAPRPPPEAAGGALGPALLWSGVMVGAGSVAMGTWNLVTVLDTSAGQELRSTHQFFLWLSTLGALAGAASIGAGLTVSP